MEFCDNYVRTQAEQNGASCIAVVWIFNNPHGANCYPKYALDQQIVEQSGTNSARRVQYQVFQPPMYVDFSKSQAPAVQAPQSTQQPAPPPASTAGLPVQQPVSTQVPATIPAQPTTNAVPTVIPASTKNAQSTPATPSQSKTASNPTTSTAVSVQPSSLSSDHSFSNTPIPTSTILGTNNKTQIASPDTTIAVSTLPGGATLYSTIIHDTTITPASPTDLSSPLPTPPTGLSTDAKIGLAVGVTMGIILLFLLALLAIMRIRKSRTRKAKGARLNEEPEEKIVMGYQAQRSEMWASYNGIPGIHELHGDDAPELEGKRMEATGVTKIRPIYLPRPPSGTHPSKWASFSASRPHSRTQSRPELDGRNVPGTPETPNALLSDEGRPMSDALLGQRWLRRKWKFGGGSFGKSSLSDSITASEK